MVSDTEHIAVAAHHTRRARRGWWLLAAVLAASAFALAGAWLYASPYLVLEQFKANALGGDIEGMKLWADSALHHRLESVATAMRDRGVWFETGYQGFDRFEMRVRQNGPSEPLTLRFRRAGLIWRLSELSEPPEPVAEGSGFAHLLGEAGTEAARFIELPDVRERVEKLLGADLAILKDSLSVSAGVQVENSQIFLAGCAPNACKVSEAAMTFDAATGEVNAAVLKDGRLTVYSRKVSVIEDLPKGMQTWLDHLAADENASIPVSFRQ